MKTIDETIDYVNNQIKFYTTRINDSKTLKKKFFQYHLDWSQNILNFLTELHDRPSLPEPQSTNIDYLTVRPEDIQGLPKEVLDELSLSDSDHADFEIVNLIKKHGGVMSLDHMIIALYKETGIAPKRKMLTAKLYRMANKNLITSVPNKRGIYKITSSTDNDQPEQEDLPME